MERDTPLPDVGATNNEHAGLDLVWGCKAIAAVIGRTERATFHMLESGDLPVARQVGSRWVASRRKLVEYFEQVAA